jgi:NADH dehydrogenase
MKVFLTGASGFVGRAVLKQLIEAGHHVTALVRHRTRGLPSGCQCVPGDLLEAGSVRVGRVDAVIHLVGIIAEVGRNTFDAVHRVATANVVTAAREAGVRRVIHMSALGTRPDAVSRYHQSKWAGEEIVRNSGLDFTIFRPSIIYGVGDQFVNQFERMSRLSPVLPVMGGGWGTFQPIPVESVARAFVMALEQPHSVGRTIDLVGSEVLTLAQILDAIMEVKGRRRLKVRVPTPAARLMAGGCELLFSRFLGRTPPLNRDQVVMLDERNIGDSVPARSLFGLEPVLFKDGLRSMFAASA